MDSRFNYSDIEDKYRDLWIEKDYGSSAKDTSRPFTMVIPPPNVTGQLHMGHALNNTLMDFYIRLNRLQGRDSILIPGTDHAGIATQSKVERVLLKDGITKESLGKDKFMEKVQEWKDEHGGIIIDQLKKMGCLYDWKHEHFTMEPKFTELVSDIFIRLYNDGLIYQSEYINNWCPKLQTALSNDEVVHVEQKSKMYHIRYKIKDSSGADKGHVIIATTRPETILGDTAIAYNPDDERYQYLKDYTANVPFVDREIKFVADEHVKSDLGTGLVKITPAHDFNDYAVGKRHNLQFIQILDKNAHVYNTGTEFDGMYKLKARKIIVEKLKEMELYERTITHKNTVGTCYRSGDVIEPMISKQWFVKMKPLAEAAQKAVNDGEIQFFPEYHKKIFNNWMNNIQDWCISRQIWWGHRIPIWYENTTGEVKCQKESPGDNYTQDPDVLDTWFSSWLWPFGVIEPDEFERRYPTDMLITGADILFFWVSRMIMSSMYIHKKVPFRKVYFHGIVRAPDGDKMSKSKGNVINPLDVIDKYGVDAMRFTLTMFTPSGKDIEYSPKHLKKSRNLLTKLWNTIRFYKMTFESKPNSEIPDLNKVRSADMWVVRQFVLLMRKLTYLTRACDLAQYASNLHEFLYDFCCNYLEYCKVMDVDHNSHAVFKNVLEGILLFMHPITPFITEELWRQLGHTESILESRFPDDMYFLTDSVAKATMDSMADDFEMTTKILSVYRRGEEEDLRKIETDGVSISYKGVVVADSDNVKYLTSLMLASKDR